MRKLIHISARVLRRIVIAVLGLLLLVAIFLNSNYFDTFIRDQIQTRLAKAIHRKITVESVAFNPFRLDILLKNFYIENDARAADVPLFSAEEVYARVSWRHLLSGRVRISQVRLKKPLVSIIFFKEGGNNWPKTGPKKEEKDKKKGIHYILSKVDVDGMTVIFNYTKIPVSFSVEQLETFAEWDPVEKNYISSTNFENGYLKIKDFNFWKFDMQSTYRIIGDNVRFDRLFFLSERSKFYMAGMMYHPRDPFFDIRFRSTINLQQTKEMFKLGPQMAGSGRYRAQYKGSFTRFRMKGSGEFKNFSFFSLPIQSATFDLDMTDNWLSASNIQAEMFGGTYSGTFGIDPLKGHSIFKADAKWQNWDGRKLGEFVHMQDLVLPVKSSGEAKFRWEENGFKDITADVGFRLEPTEIVEQDLASDAENSNFDNALYARSLILPFRNETTFRIAGRKLQEIQSHLETPYTELDVDGNIDFSGQADLNVRSRSEKITEIDLLFHYLQSYFRGRPAKLQEFWGVRGSAGFTGKLDSTVWNPFRPRLTGHIEGSEVFFHGVPMDTVEAHVQFQDKLIEIFSSRMTLGDASGTTHAKFFLEDRDQKTPNSLDLVGELQNFPAFEIPHAFGMELPIHGTVNASVTLKGPFHELEGRAEFEALNGDVWGEEWDRATGTVLFLPDSLGLHEITAYLGQGKAQASGSLEYGSYDYDVEVAAENIPLDRLNVLKENGWDLKGIGSASGGGQGSLSRPDLAGELKLRDLQYHDELYGDLEARIQLSPEILAIDATGMSRGVPSYLRGQLQLDGELPFEADFHFQKFPLEVLTKAYSPETERLAGFFGGNFRLNGTFRPRILEKMDGTLDFIELNIAGLKLREANPLEVELAGDQVRIKNCQLKGEYSTVSAKGTIFPKEQGRLELDVAAQVGLETLSLWSDSVTANGNSTLRVAVTGTWRSPELKGVLEIKDGFFRHTSLPNSLSEVQALLSFRNRDLNLESFHAISSGGKLTAGGSGVLKGYSLDSYRFDIYAEEMRVHFPQGLRSTISGELHLQSGQQGSYMTGDIRMLQGLYSQSFEEAPDLFRYSRVPAFAGVSQDSSPLQDVELNIKIRTERNLLFRNNFANMETTANVTIIGTLRDPVVTGRIEVVRGDIVFQNRSYRVLRGSLDFSNPYRTEPQLNFSAEARIREYTINLSFNGTFDRIYHEVVSDPPLPRDDLYALLGSGAAPGETQDSNTTALLAGEQISRFITGPIASPLEQGFRKAFGLQRFQIDPTYVQSTQVATARVTVQKDITRDLSFIYSTNLFTAAEEIFFLQYQLTNEIQVTAYRDEVNRWGLDVLVTKSFE